MVNRSRPIHNLPKSLLFERTPEPDPKLVDGPERNLVAGILLRHVKDLFGIHRFESDQAYRWIFRKPSGFDDYVSWMGWEPDELREVLWQQYCEHVNTRNLKPKRRRKND